MQIDAPTPETEDDDTLFELGRMAAGERDRATMFERQAEELLESVKLTAAATTRTAAYSGGMRRRLRWVGCSISDEGR